MTATTPGQLNLAEAPPWGSRSVDCYENLEQIGEGTHGHVYMAREIKTGEVVALKKIRMDNETEGFPITAIREIKILKKLHHKNVVKLKEIVTSPGPEKDEQGRPADGHKHKGSIYMVFEYMDHDLTGLAYLPGMRFTVPQIKCYMRQLLTGLHYCHVNKVLHRDIKGSNLLIDNEGNLKLADFGLARSFSSDDGNLTNCVITLWYRPPELLLGTTNYGPAVDMWSVGCIFAELLHGKPILPGKNELEQLTKIFELCGTPDEVNWPGVSRIPLYNNFKPSHPMRRRVREVFKHFDHHALDLLERMLTLDPSQGEVVHLWLSVIFASSCACLSCVSMLVYAPKRSIANLFSRQILWRLECMLGIVSTEFRHVQHKLFLLLWFGSTGWLCIESWFVCPKPKTTNPEKN